MCVRLCLEGLMKAVFSGALLKEGVGNVRVASTDASVLLRDTPVPEAPDSTEAALLAKLCEWWQSRSQYGSSITLLRKTQIRR